MNFTLEVRMIDERDLSPDTSFLPEDDEYEMYLSALLEDLSRIDVICEVKTEESRFQIETTCSMLPADLRAFIKPMITSNIINNLRFVSLLEHVVSSEVKRNEV